VAVCAVNSFFVRLGIVRFAESEYGFGLGSALKGVLGLGLKESLRTIFKSLALALKVKSLSLALALALALRSP